MPAPTTFLWNSHGMSVAKAGYITGGPLHPYANYDLVVIVEANSTAHLVNGTTEYSKGGSAGIMLEDSADNFRVAVSKALGEKILRPTAGKSVTDYYETVSPNGSVIARGGFVNYETNNEIVNWILRPMEEYIKRAQLPITATLKRERYRSGRCDWIQDKFLEKKSLVKQQVQARVNVLGTRRPRYLTVGGWTVYYWHAPQDGGYPPGQIGLRNIQHDNRVGPIANCANQVFAIFIGMQTWNAGNSAWNMVGFPANKMLAGDLNIEGGTVAAVFPASQIASSHDDLCHFVYPLPVKATATDPGAIAPVGGPVGAAQSDHAPVSIH